MQFKKMSEKDIDEFFDKIPTMSIRSFFIEQEVNNFTRKGLIKLVKRYTRLMQLFCEANPKAMKKLENKLSEEILKIENETAIDESNYTKESKRIECETHLCEYNTFDENTGIGTICKCKKYHTDEPCNCKERSILI